MSMWTLPDDPPFSFRLGGTPSATLLPTWDRRLDEETLARRLILTSPDGTLKVTVEQRRFAASAAMDWTVWFENLGEQDSPILEDVLALDLALPTAEQVRVRLHHANGSLCRADDFLPREDELRPGARFTLAPRGGRSSNGVLPFMNLRHGDGGVVLAIGWSGQWSATFSRDGSGVRLCAGMEYLRMRLRPGERMRTPRILLVPWEGTREMDGGNALRRLLLDHYLPRVEGELAWPPIAQCLQAHYYVTGAAGAHLEMRALPRAAELGLDAYWVDACWYGRSANWSEAVGTWTPYQGRFPQGLKPIADAAHAAGMKFVLWFEPERVRPDTDIDVEHPRFLLRRSDDTANALFDLGNPEARAWMTDLLSARITEYGVDIYRQDFNLDPLPYWREADEPGREGSHEIGHVLGLYAMWDELRRRHPSLVIDNCASGGRRIDLETVSRALPLWPSDYPDIGGVADGARLHVGSQCINAGLARWVPLFGGGVWSFTPYSVRSTSIGGWSFGYHLEDADLPGLEDVTWSTSTEIAGRGVTLLDPGFPMDLARRAVREQKEIRPFFTGDFYPLLPITAADHDWCAWQFHLPDLDAGIVMVFRRHRSPYARIDLHLEAVDADAWYEVTQRHDDQVGSTHRHRGAELTALEVEISQRPGSVLLRYARHT